MNFVMAYGEFCVDFDAPSAPSNLTVSGAVGNILLTWDNATDEPSCSGIDYYNISRNNVFLGSVTSLNFIDTDSTLTQGNYNYTVFAVDKVGHNKGDSRINEVKLTKDEETGTINVGGGGGGSSYVAPDSFETYLVADWELKEGFAKDLEKQDRMLFDYDDEAHGLTILNVDYDKVEVIIRSTPQKAIFKEGESKSFDLNNDSIDDLIVSVGSINNSFAEIKIQSLNEDSKKNDPVDLGFSSMNFEDKDNKNFFSTITGGIVGAIGTTGIVVVGIFITLAIGGFIAIKIRKKG